MMVGRREMEVNGVITEEEGQKGYLWDSLEDLPLKDMSLWSLRRAFVQKAETNLCYRLSDDRYRMATVNQLDSDAVPGCKNSILTDFHFLHISTWKYFKEACAFSIAGNLVIRAPQPSSAEMPPQLSDGLNYSAKIVRGSLDSLPQAVREFVESSAKLCRPDQVHICDGSEEENRQLLSHMEEEGVIKRLKKYDNCWLALTDPRDVARIESKTVIITREQRDTVPIPKTGLSQLGRWMSEEDFEKAFNVRFPGCMKGRTMYVIPFSMGPLGSPLSKIGIELTDSPYVVTSMRIMTRMGAAVLEALGDGEFVKCLHSVGCPLPLKKPLVNNWACNPELTLIAHLPDRREIISFGSGYGGNSLLGKKCFALRMASRLAKEEGWLAEHMLILGITNPKGQKKYFAAAFPSACGKTNLAMMNPTLPGWKVECVGDDIAWMKFDQQGNLRAINPENGFFGVAPGTSVKTNPNAIKTIQKNTIFTNVAETSDGGVYWEGIDQPLASGIKLISWKGKEWDPKDGEPCAHPNSRFCTPASQCPIIDPDWESPEGVPIEGIIFGGRRPVAYGLTVPLKSSVSSGIHVDGQAEIHPML
ncbi:hypothetical protein MJT46_011506 [Ovis ammon polii x Ovis aries]|nr:hypothetical protein MJT46_011506 [Ovis ammon polii x Ovis aries]